MKNKVNRRIYFNEYDDNSLRFTQGKRENHRLLVSNNFPVFTKQRYLYNGGFLLLITMLWNVIFSQYLPEAFSLENFRMNIPTIVLAGENVFRILTFGFTVFLMLGLRDRTQKTGLILYIGGVVLYFASWAAQMFLPNAIWSQSLIGFTAPAFTPIIWLLGIGFLGKELVIKKIPYNRMVFITLSIAFVVFHTAHAVMAYINQY